MEGLAHQSLSTPDSKEYENKKIKNTYTDEAHEVKHTNITE